MIKFDVHDKFGIKCQGFLNNCEYHIQHTTLLGMTRLTR